MVKGFNGTGMALSAPGQQGCQAKKLLQGVIAKQTDFVLIDPYANAFYNDPARISEWKNDLTDMKPGVHERKWEIDSLCYVIRLSHGLLYRNK